MIAAPPPTDAPDASLDTVAVVGDSLTDAADEAIRTELGELGLDIVGFDAVPGRRMTWGRETLSSGADAIDRILTASGGDAPDLWVVALGTNDVGAQSDVATMTAEMRGLLDRIGGDTPVVWVDVYIRDRADAAWELDLAMQQIAGERSNVTLAEWFPEATEDGVLLDDGVHLTDAGEQRFATLIANTCADVLEAAA